MLASYEEICITRQNLKLQKDALKDVNESKTEQLGLEQALTFFRVER